jgi:predicted HicB family RNase H-like nuclease
MSGPVPRLHVDIDAELHRRAKIVAAQRELTMKKLVTQAVEQFVEQAEHDEEGKR